MSKFLLKNLGHPCIARICNIVSIPVEMIVLRGNYTVFKSGLCNGWARNGNGIQGARGRCGWELGSRNRHGWGGNVVEGQGMVEDVTFCDSGGGMTRAGLSARRMEMRRLG
jgi:hypothetical protein